MGIGCTREEERIYAALGLLNEATPEFESNRDVKSAGVLLALPSLLLNGLLKYSDQNFRLPKGYYGLQSLLMILAFAALLRIKSIEQIRYSDPGELGKLVGLDRIPEVKTLRKKIDHLTGHGDPEEWGKQLAKLWMETNPDLAGTLYVDGHVRVYHGKQTKLPKRYVAREKLCLRGLTDYWINDALGQPFFVVTEVVNSGMLAVLREKIIPRLLDEVPGQPPQQQLNADKYSYRFGLVFDREGYSPAFFKEMWEKRIACYTYRKYVTADWPESEFAKEEVVLPNGEVSLMKIAERGVYYRKEKLWVREIRKLTDSDHQTALITTDYCNAAGEIAGKMFSRWSQENFFKYMMQHYGIDKLIDYTVVKMDETIKVVSPVYRQIENQIRSENAKLSRKTKEYGELILETEIEQENVQKYAKEKSELKETIDSLKQKIETLKAKKKKVDKHVSFCELSEPDQFKNLKSSGKQFIDTIKMIAYRAETSMVNILGDYVLKKDEARSIVRQIFTTDADMEPDYKNGLLKVTLHNMTTPRNNRYVAKLCAILNASETLFPGTNLRLFYDLVSIKNHAGKEF